MSEKDYYENDEVFSGKSITSHNKFFGNCTAISPDSRQIVTFNPSKDRCEFKLYDIDDLSSSKRTFTSEGVTNNLPCWSIAISNCVDNKKSRLIALSCFSAKELEIHGDDKNDEKDLESGNKYLRPQTLIISITDEGETYTYLGPEPIGGVVRFLDSDDSDCDDGNSNNNGDDSDQPLKNRTVLIIVNVSGIYKETMNHIKRKIFFSRSPTIKQFELPQKLSKRLSKRLSSIHWEKSFKLLHKSIIRSHFIVHSFENEQQIIEMYSLITGDLEMLFKRYENLVASNMIRGSPIFAISQNEKILAFCQQATSITLYSMENGLEITTKQLEGQIGIYKILDVNFIDDDSKLLIVLEEKEDRQREDSVNHQIFVVWDLFTTFKNSIRQIDYSETKKPLKMDLTYRLMNSPGNMFAVRDGGDVFSVLDHKDVASIRDPSVKAIKEINIPTSGVDHVIYTVDGKICDQLIIDNVEPWQPNKKYLRISVFLDSTKSTQLIISHNTIQVWKWKRHSNNITEEPDKGDRILEYIRARKKEIKVQELKVGEREFVLKVSTNSTASETKTIHWPNNVNILEGACQALYVLTEKKHENSITSFKNVKSN
ncbi:7661_t:CDS:2 [Diversispora eburnea]|uniref:7661_t:CDS:1 n=1 Tax=Diversispora eburnea TaxID=1213867 RepID=A0A9N9GHV6_9GLOM|nr:7661_t:CDS:2 [Diversispora eburnea]